MKSKVTKCENTGTWTSPEGKTFYKFDIEFENGDRADFLQQTNEVKHPVGSEEDYEISTTDKGYKKIKFNKPGGFTRGGAFQKSPEEEKKRQEMIVRQSSLKCATDLVCNGKVDYDDLLLIAQVLTDWALGDIEAHKMREPSNEMPF